MRITSRTTFCRTSYNNLWMFFFKNSDVNSNLKNNRKIIVFKTCLPCAEDLYALVEVIMLANIVWKKFE